jgi:DENN (AEX-3) domain/uDENN domain
MPGATALFAPLFEVFVVVVLPRSSENAETVSKPSVSSTFPPLAPNASPEAVESREKDIAALPDFCFADDPFQFVGEERQSSLSSFLSFESSGDFEQLSHVSEAPFSFVLTESDGSRRFGFCRRRIDDQQAKAFCFLTTHPWFGLFDQLLGAVDSQEKATMMSVVQQYLQTALEEVVVPPSLPAPVSLALGIVPIAGLVGAGWSEYGDVPMDALLSSLSPKNVARVIGAASLERRIIMSSSSLSRVSRACVGLLAALYPFQWQHICIPVLPGSLLHYCCAPMPFIVGIPAASLPALQTLPLEAVVFVDLDDDTVVSGGTDEGNADASMAQAAEVSQYDPIDDIPPPAVHAVKSAVRSAVSYSKKRGNNSLRGDSSSDSDSVPLKSRLERLREGAEHAFLSFWLECGFSKWAETAPTEPYDGSSEDADSVLANFHAAIEGIKGVPEWFESFKQTQMFDVFVHQWQERQPLPEETPGAEIHADQLHSQLHPTDPIAAFALLVARPESLLPPYADTTEGNQRSGMSLLSAISRVRKKGQRSGGQSRSKGKFASLRNFGKKDAKHGAEDPALVSGLMPLDIDPGRGKTLSAHSSLSRSAEDSLELDFSPDMKPPGDLKLPPAAASENSQDRNRGHRGSAQPKMTLNEILNQKSRLAGGRPQSRVNMDELRRLGESWGSGLAPTPAESQTAAKPAAAVEDRIMSVRARAELQRRLTRSSIERPHFIPTGDSPKPVSVVPHERRRPPPAPKAKVGLSNSQSVPTLSSGGPAPKRPGLSSSQSGISSGSFSPGSSPVLLRKVSVGRVSAAAARPPAPAAPVRPAAGRTPVPATPVRPVVGRNSNSVPATPVRPAAGRTSVPATPVRVASGSGRVAPPVPVRSAPPGREAVPARSARGKLPSPPSAGRGAVPQTPNSGGSPGRGALPATPDSGGHPTTGRRGPPVAPRGSGTSPARVSPRGAPPPVRPRSSSTPVRGPAPARRGSVGRVAARFESAAPK